MSAKDRQADELLQAFIASEDLETAAGYVAAGRRYGGLSDSVLERTWASAYMGYYLQGQRHRWIDCLDAEGELTLRGLSCPMRLIPAKTRKRIAVAIRKKMRKADVVREMRPHFQDFMRRRERAN